MMTDTTSRDLSRRPSSARYELLLRRLRATTSPSPKNDPLDGPIEALDAVLSFLIADPETRHDRTFRALGELHLALHDLRSGGNPELLFKKRSTGGRPPRSGLDNLRVNVALAIDCLMEVGQSERSAAQWVAKEATSSGILVSAKGNAAGQPLRPETASRWRHEMGSNPASPAERMYRQRSARRTLPQSTEEAEELARRYLQMLLPSGILKNPP